MKLWKRIVLGIAGIILALLLAFGASFVWYYPHYRMSKEPVDIAVQTAPGEVQVMSCNLRCINPLDFGKKSWFYRADLLVDGVAEAAPGVVGFQEATKWQYNYLCDVLTGYGSVIEYRDNAVNSEGCPIFYRTDLYDRIDSGSFWLSETPEQMSKSWGAAFSRICSYVILEDRATGAQFAVFNTHLDHESEEARINGIGVVLGKIEEFGGIPAVLMGDLNAEEDSETYRSATESFFDVKYQTEDTRQGATYQNWGTELDRDCIDYILISKTGFAVESYRVMNETRDGVYTSDHFPICALLRLTETETDTDA